MHKGQVIHHPELAEWPHYIGSNQVRNFRLEGDRLILSSEETRPGGERRRYEITWAQVPTDGAPQMAPPERSPNQSPAH